MHSRPEANNSISVYNCCQCDLPYNIGKSSEDWFEVVLQSILVTELLDVGGSRIEVVTRHGREQTGGRKRASAVQHRRAYECGAGGRGVES